MIRQITALIAGILFGAGLAISQMVNPDKVLSFLDIAGRWDPSLALVMGGALAVTFVGYRLVLGRGQPVFADRFELPTARDLDSRLLAGAGIFGIGWGLVGFCPGPALASLAFARFDSVLFILAMLAGAALYIGADRYRLLPKTS